ncbi:MAG: 16S rRNA (uracil(1498)-N(3))-methyltransferase [Sedimentisphaerales bacterium]|nr:16S rRNA (uracil(1498)-N(3))-methyltransferase [Sedimentisphaerales bacterium]
MGKIDKNRIKDRKRFYYSPITSDTIIIEDQEAKHISRVLRMEIGDQIEFFDGHGTLAQGKIVDISKGSVEVRLENIEKVCPYNAQCPIIIAASVAKSDRFEWLVSKCTELGVTKIYPLLCERTVKQPGNEKKTLERYENIIVQAGKQSHNLHLPEIFTPVNPEELLDIIKKDYPLANLLIGSPEPQAGNITQTFKSDRPNIAFIGPEGGFTDDEIELFKTAGAIEVRMTDSILRIETAAIAFAAILCTLRDSE